MAIDIAYKASVDIGDGAKSLKSLKQEFKETQKELDGLTAGSEKYVQTLKKLGKVKDDIGDLNDEINAFTPEGKVKAFSTVIGGVASGFQAATGAAALFGGENKELEKQLVKLQAVMAFSEGIKGLTGLGDGFKVLKQTIMANPIFLVVGIVTAIGTAMFALKDKVSFIGDAFDALGKVISTVVQAGKDFLDFLGATDFAATKVADSIIKSNERIKNANSDRYDSEISAAKRAGTATELIEIAKLSSITKTNDAVIAQLKARKLANGELSDDDQKKLDELVKENKKAYNDILNLSDKYNDDRRDKDAEKKKQHDQKELAEAEKKAAFLKTLIDKAVAEQKANDAKELENTLSLIEKVAKLKEDESIRLAANEQEVLDIKLAKDLAEIESEYAKTNLGVEAYQAKKDALLLIESKYNDDINTLRKKDELTEEEKKIKEAAQDRQRIQDNLENVKNSLVALQGLSDLFFSIKMANVKKGSKEEEEAAKKQFKINKALQLSNALITGVSSILAITSVPDFTLGIATAVRIGAQVALNAASIAKIAATQYNAGGGGGSMAPISAPNVGTTPTINAPSQSTTSLNPNGSVRTINTAPTTIKAYVVETEITGTQNQVSQIENLARHE